MRARVDAGGPRRRSPSSRKSVTQCRQGAWIAMEKLRGTGWCVFADGLDMSCEKKRFKDTKVCGQRNTLNWLRKPGIP